ncbi:MFS transporter [Phytohabitans sp. LJ34]|uniref:MFS transporter n=1 Tax=Phytohabitans sp. LJ34 TaxID=3452217 RepID=UPI003F8BC90B
MRPRSASGSGPLHYPGFRWLTLGQAVNLLGNGIAPIALAFAVLDITGSLVALGLVVGAASVANVAFLLLGGLLADRLRRDLVLTGSALLGMASQAVAAILVLGGDASVPVLAFLSACGGAFAAFARPAFLALAPQTVPAALRRRANSISGINTNTAMVVGASVGGLLVAAVGPGWGLAVDAATFGLAALCFRSVRWEGTATRAATPLLVDLREGWSEFARRSWIWMTVVCFCFVNAAYSGATRVLGPAQADQTFGRAAWGLVLAAYTVGLVLGGLVALWLRPRRPLLIGVVCVLPMALPPLALAARPAVQLMLAAMLLSGLGVAQFSVAWATSLQQEVPAEVLGRVYSYDLLGSYVAIPAGQLAIGPVADRIGRGETLAMCGLVIVAGVGGMLSTRGVRRLRTRPQDHKSLVEAV